MHINLNQLINTLNELYKEPDFIQFEYTEDKDIRVSKGNVAVFTGFDDMKQVLSANNVDLSKESQVYEVLAKYFVNQLSASTGRKAFPEVISISSSHI